MRSNDSQKIIVVGIPKSMDDTGLSDLFSSFGTVADAKVVLDTSTKQSRGFGFVTFTATSSMTKAIEGMDKKTIEGRTLNVRHLIPKDKFQKKTDTNDSSSKQRPCWLLRKGKCTKGDACPFSHDIKDGEFGSCFEFVQTGSCKRGDKCIFSHPKNEEDNEEESDEEEHFQDITSTSKNSQPTKTSTKTTTSNVAPVVDPNRPRVCYSFQNGRCHRGKKCLFLHEKLQPLDKSQAKIKSKQQKTTKETFEVVQDKNSTAMTSNSSSTVGKKRPRKEEEEEEVPKAEKKEEEDAPLQGLAAHVLNYVQSHKKPSTNQMTGTKSPPTTTEPSAVVNQSPLQKKKSSSSTKTEDRPQKYQDRPRYIEDRPQKKKQKKQKIDMGTAFDGCLSDEEEVSHNSRKKKKPTREEMKATRQKLQQQRKEKRDAKKNALERLKQQQQ